MKYKFYSTVVEINGVLVNGDPVKARTYGEAQQILNITRNDGSVVSNVMSDEFPGDAFHSPVKSLEVGNRLNKVKHAHTCPTIDQAKLDFNEAMSEIVKTPNTRRKLNKLFEKYAEEVRNTNKSLRAAANSHVKTKSIFHDWRRLKYTVRCFIRWAFKSK